MGPGTGTPVGDPLTDHTGPVRSVAFGWLPDGRVLLATGGWDRTVRLWTFDNAQSARTYGMCSLAPSMPQETLVEASTAYVTCDDGVIALNLDALRV